jgi:hypothetical protein
MVWLPRETEKAIQAMCVSGLLSLQYSTAAWQECEIMRISDALATLESRDAGIPSDAQQPETPFDMVFVITDLVARIRRSLLVQ